MQENTAFRAYIAIFMLAVSTLLRAQQPALSTANDAKRTAEQVNDVNIQLMQQDIRSERKKVVANMPLTDTEGTRPNNPVAFNTTAYWFLVASGGAAAIADAQMSHAYLATHPGSREASSWLLGQRPSLARYYITFAMVDGGTALISYKLLHCRRKPVRIIGWCLLGGLTAIHTHDDILMAGR
jgi:hypothetical protein